MFIKELALDEIKFGEIWFSDENKEFFPMHGEELTFVDVTGQKYTARVHPIKNYIEGVWHMHKNNEVLEGTAITIRIIDERYNLYRVYYSY